MFTSEIENGTLKQTDWGPAVRAGGLWVRPYMLAHAAAPIKSYIEALEKALDTPEFQALVEEYCSRKQGSWVVRDLRRDIEACRRIISEYRRVERIRQGEAVYIRFGDLPKRSRDYVTGEVLAGVSVYAAYACEDGDYMVIPTGPTWSTYLFLQDRTAHVVAGTRVGTGPDGEPLLQKVRIVRAANIVGRLTGAMIE